MMMKLAADMAMAAREARALALEEQRAEQEEAEQIARWQEWLDETHRQFEMIALSSARTGELSVVVSGHSLSLSRLDAQGFNASQLRKRESFEQHLVSALKSNWDVVVDLAEQIVASCPGLDYIDGDDLLHRNPLLSWLETLWQREKNADLFNVMEIIYLSPISNKVSIKDLEANEKKLDQLLKYFISIKSTEQKLSSVRWENQIIPQDADEATYISWESADDGDGKIVHFCAERLKWLATTWPLLAASLSERIAEAASEGGSQLCIFVWRTSEDWKLSLSWPPESEIDDGDGTDIYSQTTGVWEGEAFCAPSLLAEELSLFGYEVEVQAQPLQDEMQSESIQTEDMQHVLARVGEAHRVVIRWE